MASFEIVETPSNIREYEVFRAFLKYKLKSPSENQKDDIISVDQRKQVTLVK